MAHVIIPTKSNIDGLSFLIPMLVEDPWVTQLTVVTDGARAWDLLSAHFPDIALHHHINVREGVGIHRMWNEAMEETVGDQHVLFLNDDVVIEPLTIMGLEQTLNTYPTLGLVCPQYTNVPVPEPYQPVFETCGSRYDGTGGLAGFCMMLRSDLAKEWRFDERMKWWCGDDDVMHWVTRVKGLDVGITPYARCTDNDSWTVRHDPPRDLYQVTQRDIRIFQEKWS